MFNFLLYIILYIILSIFYYLFTHTTDEELNAWYSHYKFLALNPSGYNFSKDLWKDSNAFWNLGTPR